MITSLLKIFLSVIFKRKKYKKTVYTNTVIKSPSTTQPQINKTYDPNSESPNILTKCYKIHHTQKQTAIEEKHKK